MVMIEPVKYKVQCGTLEAEMLLGTYPIINLVMTKNRDINGKAVKFRYVLTFGFEFAKPEELYFVSMEKALQIMNDEINKADITDESKLYPQTLGGWIYYDGIYSNSGAIGTFARYER